jgi:hypothetical protein
MKTPMAHPYRWWVKKRIKGTIKIIRVMLRRLGRFSMGKGYSLEAAMQTLNVKPQTSDLIFVESLVAFPSGLRSKVRCRNCMISGRFELSV